MSQRKTYDAAIVALALIAGGIFYFVFGNKEADTAQVGSAVATETVAAEAGARVSPTEPPMKVEPK